MMITYISIVLVLHGVYMEDNLFGHILRHNNKLEKYHKLNYF